MTDIKTILLVDKNAESLAKTLPLYGYKVVVADCCEQALKLLKEKSSYNIVLFNMDVPDSEAWYTLKAIKSSDMYDKDISIICLSEDSDYRKCVTALNLGADDYIVIPANLQVILARISAVLRRSKCSGIKQSVSNVTNNQKSDLKSLTAREKDVLLLVTQGLDNSSIAKELYVSTITVKAHLQSIFKKLKVKNRTQAVLTVMENNLISKEK